MYLPSWLLFVKRVQVDDTGPVVKEVAVWLVEYGEPTSEALTRLVEYILDG